MRIRTQESGNNPRSRTGQREGRRRRESNQAVLDTRRERHLIEARRVLLMMRPAAERWLTKHGAPSTADTPPPNAIELADASPRGLAPIDATGETSAETLPGDFSRNERPTDVVSPGEPSPGRVQRLLFDANAVEGCSNAAA